jgi:hypothetical protein
MAQSIILPMKSEKPLQGRYKIETRRRRQFMKN